MAHKRLEDYVSLVYNDIKKDFNSQKWSMYSEIDAI